MVDCLRHGHADHDGLDWPQWMPVLLGGIAVAAAAISLAQRGAFWPPDWALLVALAAVSPWLVERAGWLLPPWLFATVVIAATAVLLLDPAQLDLAPFILLVLACEAGATMSARGSGAVVLVAAAVLWGLDLTQSYSGAPAWILGLGSGWAFGFAMQGQLRLLAQERAEREALAGKLAAEARQRMAREVHDVIAHSLTVTMLHLTAARHTLEADRDVDEAIDALREAERLGRQATADVRRTVGLLDGYRGDTRPAPRLGDLDGLVAQLRTAGLQVRYRLAGDAAAVDQAAGLELYRIAQESLVNAARHAPGAPIDVTLDVSGDPLRLTVRNAVPAPAPAGRPGSGQDDGAGFGFGPGGGAGGAGLGLKGMEQRAALLGGTFRAGPDDGGWCVAVTAPRTPPGP